MPIFRVSDRAESLCPDPAKTKSRQRDYMGGISFMLCLIIALLQIVCTVSLGEAVSGTLSLRLPQHRYPPALPNTSWNRATATACDRSAQAFGKEPEPTPFIVSPPIPPIRRTGPTLPEPPPRGKTVPEGELLPTAPPPQWIPVPDPVIQPWEKLPCERGDDARCRSIH